MKRLLLPLLLIAAPTFAYDDLSYDEFYNVKENSDKLELLVQSGNMEKLRGQMQSICKQWGQDKENLDKTCECLTREVNKLSDKDLYYSSTIAYQRYLARVDAIKNHDDAELARLKKLSKEVPLVDKQLEHACEPK